MFSQLKRAATVNVAFGFFLENLEDGTCRYLHAHANRTVMEKSELVCTEDDMTKRRKIQKCDIFDYFKRKRPKTIWLLYKNKKVTVFFRYSKMYPWVVKNCITWTSFENPQYQLSYFREEKVDNPKLTTTVCLKQLHCICMVTTNW